MTLVIGFKDKKTGITRNVVTSHADLHRTFWRRKEDFPNAKTHEVLINGFVIPNVSQDKIAEAFNTPDMDFGKTFERGYWELYILARQTGAIQRSMRAQ